MTSSSTLIRIGHPAYQGANAMRLCFSKAQAVRVLRNRGVKRDDARKVVQKTLAEGGCTISSNGLDVIEVSNMSHRYWDGYYVDTFDVLRRQWAGRSEA